MDFFELELDDDPSDGWIDFRVVHRIIHQLHYKRENVRIVTVQGFDAETVPTHLGVITEIPLQ